jgi:hypothetical protein
MQEKTSESSDPKKIYSRKNHNVGGERAKCSR